MSADADVLIIGAGPAGAATAIWLAQAGWRVLLVEKHGYPRDKVCGECIAGGNIGLFDALGVGRAVRAQAGAELREVAWMCGTETTVAALPRTEVSEVYGRALGRDRLDTLLVARCRELGVVVRHRARDRRGSRCVRLHAANALRGKTNNARARRRGCARLLGGSTALE
jgi:2-polyprenyl-6-methoxyphenol hydroxylase-like FAD-dependent oxidoreductase